MCSISHFPAFHFHVLADMPTFDFCISPCGGSLKFAPFHAASASHTNWPDVSGRTSAALPWSNLCRRYGHRTLFRMIGVRLVSCVILATCNRVQVHVLTGMYADSAGVQRAPPFADSASSAPTWFQQTFCRSCIGTY